MKKNSIISALVGLILGSIVTYIYCSNDEAPAYFELSEDVYIGEIGNLKKGTIVRYDESYPEGFTRFILYLNAKGIDLKEYKTEKNEIIPYWLEKE